jgi:hypothetical protein
MVIGRCTAGRLFGNAGRDPSLWPCAGHHRRARHRGAGRGRGGVIGYRASGIVFPCFVGSDVGTVGVAAAGDFVLVVCVAVDLGSPAAVGCLRTIGGSIARPTAASSPATG